MKNLKKSETRFTDRQFKAELLNAMQADLDNPFNPANYTFVMDEQHRNLRDLYRPEFQMTLPGDSLAPDDEFEGYLKKLGIAAEIRSHDAGCRSAGLQYIVSTRFKDQLVDAGFKIKIPEVSSSARAEDEGGPKVSHLLKDIIVKRTVSDRSGYIILDAKHGKQILQNIAMPGITYWRGLKEAKDRVFITDNSFDAVKYMGATVEEEMPVTRGIGPRGDYRNANKAGSGRGQSRS